MKKKLKYVIVLLIIAIILVLCGSYTKYDESKMPLIVFQFMLIDDSFNYPNAASTWTIDNQGNIFYFNDSYYFHQEEQDALAVTYEALKQLEHSRYVGTIDIDILREKYSLLLDIIRDGHYEKDITGHGEGEVCDVTLEMKGIYRWNAYSYDKDGEIKLIKVYEEGALQYVSEDKRMLDIADWIDMVLEEDKKNSVEICKDLKYRDVLEEKEKSMEDLLER